MSRITRRQVLRASGAVGATAALTMTARPAWSWSSTGSIAGTATSVDPAGVWDDLADPLVASLIDRGAVPATNTALASWVLNSDAVPGATPAGVQSFIASARQLPAWADQDKLDRAAAFHKRNGMYVAVLYGMGSGMMSCLIPHEARAVYYSRGGADMKDRIAKTAKLGYDIGAVNAYQAGGEMVVTAVKTRMVHAAVRHLLPSSPYWKPTADQPAPISQLDLLVTWHSLATFVRQGLDTWRVPVSAADSDAYLHLWQVSAHMLGIRDEYIPATWADAFAQRPQVLDAILATTNEGLKLAEILLNLGSDADGGFASREMLEGMTRYTLGDTYADWLGISRNPMRDQGIKQGWPLYIAWREGSSLLPLVPEVHAAFDEFLRQGALYYLGEGKRINIVIPDGNRTSF